MPDANRQPQPARRAELTPNSVHLCTVADVPIRIHFTFFLFLAWLAWTQSGPNRAAGVLFVIAVFACVVLHELGHAVVARRFGIEVSEVVLYPIGGVARMEKMPAPRAEFWIALAGPAVNVVIAALLLAILAGSGPLPSWSVAWRAPNLYLPKLMLSNVALVVFNMIPAFPMDGGRVLRAVLAMGIGEARATAIAASIGQLVALLLGLAGIFGPFVAPTNLILIFIAIFVFIAAGQEASVQRGREFLEGVTVRDGMVTEFHTLPSGATLGQAQEMLLNTSQTDFPIMNGEEVVGLLSRLALFQGLREEGAGAYVAEAMARDFPTAAPEAPLQELAADMQAGQQSCALVMEGGRLLGLVTMENLAELLILRQIARQKDGVVE